MKNSIIKISVAAALLLTGVTGLTGCSSEGKAASDTAAESITLTNVSYDPTRELYEAYNKLFAEHWKEKTGQDIEIRI